MERRRLPRPGLLRHRLQRAMVVAMVAVRVMQVAVDEVVDMIAMWHRRVAAARSMPVAALVAAAIVAGCAPLGISGRHLDHMLVVVIAMRIVQMAVMEIVDVVAMPDRDMAAARPVAVRVVVMNRVLGHACLLRKKSLGVSPACTTAFSIKVTTWSSATL
jgi:hypothetical protein